MSGRLNGVKKLIENVQPKSCFVYCSNHSLDLALQEVGRKNNAMCDASSMVKDVLNAILESAKSKNIYENVVLEPCYHSSELGCIKQNLLPFCPTRWSVRIKSLTRFLDNYNRVKKTLDEMLFRSVCIADDRKSTLRGDVEKLKKFKTMFFLPIAIYIFGLIEQLAKVLQNPTFCASVSIKAADVLKKTLLSFRTNEHFEKILETVNLHAEICELEPFDDTKCIQKPPKRLQYTNNLPIKLSSTCELKKDTFEIIDNSQLLF